MKAINKLMLLDLMEAGEDRLLTEMLEGYLGDKPILNLPLEEFEICVEIQDYLNAKKGLLELVDQEARKNQSPLIEVSYGNYTATCNCKYKRVKEGKGEYTPALDELIVDITNFKITVL